MQRSGDTPNAFAAARYTSGAGLGCGTSNVRPMSVFTHDLDKYMVGERFTIHQHAVTMKDNKVKGFCVHSGGDYT